MKTSLPSTKPIKISSITQNRERNVAHCKEDDSIKTAATEMINTLIKKCLADDKSELREVNRIYSRIVKRFWSQHRTCIEKVNIKLKR